MKCPVFFQSFDMVTNWKKIFVKYLVNYWKITGKRLETEQNGLINFDRRRAYFYPRDSETLSERKSADFWRKMAVAGDSP